MPSGPGLRDGASYGDRQAGAALAILQFLAPFIRQSANLHDEGWNAFIDGLIGLYGAGPSADAAEVRRVLEQMRAQ